MLNREEIDQIAQSAVQAHERRNMAIGPFVLLFNLVLAVLIIDGLLRLGWIG